MKIRFWFALKNGWQQRRLLKRFLDQPALQIQNLSDITAQRLDDAGIAILVLDFDGVLAAHGEALMDKSAENWLRQLCNIICEQRVALFTNKPFPERLQYFAEHFPMIYIVSDVPKKPYPDGLLQVANYKGIGIHRIALVDDRLLTGMLATCLAYCQGIYFAHPKRNVCQNPVRELFFSLLRVSERTFIRLFA
jgi:uncharacterized protein